MICGPLEQQKSGGDSSLLLAQVLIQYNKETNALIRRKIKPGSDGVHLLRLPKPPIPLSWGRNVEPFDPTAAAGLSARLSSVSLEGRVTYGAASKTSAYGRWLLKQSTSAVSASLPSTAAAEEMLGPNVAPGASGETTKPPIRQTADAAEASSVACSTTSRCYETSDLPSFKIPDRSLGRWGHKDPFISVLINPGWEAGGLDR